MFEVLKEKVNDIRLKAYDLEEYVFGKYRFWLEDNGWYENELGWTHKDFNDEYCSLRDAVKYQKELNNEF